MRLHLLLSLAIATVASAATYNDPAGELTIDPFPGRPLVGLSCGKTDIVEAIIQEEGANTLWKLRLADLTTACSGEAEFQPFTFMYAFRPANWDRAFAAVVVSGRGLEGAELFVEEFGCCSTTFHFPQAFLDIENDTIGMSIEKAIAAPPFASGVFYSEMQECGPGDCRFYPIVKRADRLPDVGFIEYEG